MKKESPCIICEKPVNQERSTSGVRLTCKRKKVKGVWVKSECEKEKNRRYQKKYRDNNTAGKKAKKAKKDKPVACSDNKHLDKYKVKKYKRECLKCRCKFTGIGLYNRVCNSCSIENSRSTSC